MRRTLIIVALCLLTLLMGYVGTSRRERERVIIYSSSEDYRNEYIKKRLDEQFPQYEIVLMYISTGNHAAKLLAEGTSAECDISLELESGYLEQLKNIFARLDEYPSDQYLDEFVPPHRRYATWYRISGAVIVSNEMLAKHGLPVPGSYEDLLLPAYKNLISMPNPKVSSTGYIFLKSLANTRGEDASFAYFDKLSENITQFTSSGSGPVNALIQQEAAIALGITYQAVNAINEGSDFSILYFAEGAPYSTGGMAMIDGRQKNPAVREVFDFLYGTLIYEDKERFAPEMIFKGQQNEVPNYPGVIPYADMTGILDMKEKTRLLAKWKY